MTKRIHFGDIEKTRKLPRPPALTGVSENAEARLSDWVPEDDSRIPVHQPGVAGSDCVL